MLTKLGIHTRGKVFENLSPQEWVVLACERGEGVLAANGALVVQTEKYTGRCPKDRFIVTDSETENRVAWGSVNQAISLTYFDRLFKKVKQHLEHRDLFVFRGYVGAHPRYQQGVCVVAEKAWHALFAHTLFIPMPEQASDTKSPADITVIDACEYVADGASDGVRSEVFVVLNMQKKLVLIGGTHYAGEIKKSVFTIMNYFLPKVGVLPMHCSANVGERGDTTLFFGLSGTGKTTLSADPSRHLIGDDEHGWAPEGVFNLEGGCYAKCICLNEKTEPQIWHAIGKGSVLENVVLNPKTGAPDYDSAAITENTRATYPLHHIPNAVIPSVGTHPKTIFFLTCDAFGVLPPIAKLTPAMAMYHFLSGYTAKVAGTEAGVTEPQATFSACFGAPFLPLHPFEYAKLLGELIAKFGVTVWLLNTGWSGGSYGAGSRMKIAFTRRLLDLTLSGDLDRTPCELDPVFNMWIPKECPGIATTLLHPRRTWADANAYDRQAKQVSRLFYEHFQTYVQTDTRTAISLDLSEILSAGPRIV